MAFFISKQGNPQKLLTDGGSLQLGNGLEIKDGKLETTGDGGGSSSGISRQEVEQMLASYLPLTGGDLSGDLYIGPGDLQVGDFVKSILTQDSLEISDDLGNSLKIDKYKITFREDYSETKTINWDDIKKLIDGENDNYLRQEVEGLTISSALNDLNSRVEILERKLAQAGI